MVPVAAAALGKVLAAVVMLAAAARFALTGVYEFTGRVGWERTSGWWGVGLCVVALYAALAFEVEDTRRRTILPIGRHRAGDDLSRIDHEPGVRGQL